MSTHYHNGSHYENHQRAAELHEDAAHAHLSAAEAHEKQDHETGQERSRQALEHCRLAYRQAAQMHQNPVNEHGFETFRPDDIAALAYQPWLARGCPEGSPGEDCSHAAQQPRDRKENGWRPVVLE